MRKQYFCFYGLELHVLYFIPHIIIAYKRWIIVVFIFLCISFTCWYYGIRAQKIITIISSSQISSFSVATFFLSSVLPLSSVLIGCQCHVTTIYHCCLYLDAMFLPTLLKWVAILSFSTTWWYLAMSRDTLVCPNWKGQRCATRIQWE